MFLNARKPDYQVIRFEDNQELIIELCSYKSDTQIDQGNKSRALNFQICVYLDMRWIWSHFMQRKRETIKKVLTTTNLKSYSTPTRTFHDQMAGSPSRIRMLITEDKTFTLNALNEQVCRSFWKKDNSSCRNGGGKPCWWKHAAHIVYITSWVRRKNGRQFGTTH